MGGYTHLNIKEIEDQAEKFGMAPKLEFRMARKALELEQSGLSYLRVAPNFRLPFGHAHKTQEEVYLVVSGGGRMKLEDEVVDLRQWDAVRVHKDAMRNFEAGPNGAELIAIGAPRTGPGDADTVPGWWSD